VRRRLTFGAVGRTSVIAGTLLLAVTFFSLTVAQRRYLQSQHWSPVHRTPTEWPSLLATGPHGWLLSLAFAISALSTVVFALSVITDAGRLSAWERRLDATGVLLAALGLIGITFSADPATATNISWHADVHNFAYPLIPFGVLITMLTHGLGRSSSFRAAARGMIVVTVACFALTNVDSIAQLARYPAFCLLLGWLVILSEYCLVSDQQSL
jgi:hypothetical protein